MISLTCQSIFKPSHVFFFMCLLLLTSGDDEFYKGMPKELRCSGCELTVKVLNQMLARGTGYTESRVATAMKKVCEKERFSISEYKPERVVQVCEFMKKKHGDELTKELIKYYSQDKKSTYLEFVQHICLDVTRLCGGVSHKKKHHDNEEDTVLHFDTESHGFTVVPGRNIKMPKPVASGHDEL